MTPEDYLSELIQRNPAVVESVAWPNENARWTELLFCLASRFTADFPEKARRAVAILAELGALSVDQLSSAGASNDADGPFLEREVLTCCGFDSESSRNVSRTWREVAAIVKTKWGGQIQKALREAGLRVQSDLTKNFSCGPLTEDQMALAIGHWLQNVANLPIPLGDPITRSAFDAAGLSQADVTRAADRMQLNLTAVDDLVFADKRRTGSAGGSA